MHRLGLSSAPIEHIRASTFVIPADGPESDGTCEWSSTTLVLVTAEAASTTGLGYTHADSATAELIADRLVEVVCGQDALSDPSDENAGASSSPVPIVGQHIRLDSRQAENALLSTIAFADDG